MKVLRRDRISSLLLLTIFAWTFVACGSGDTTPNSNTPVTVRLGYLRNVTHAAALVGLARNTFVEDLAPNKLAMTTFNAGPDLEKALLAGSIDIAYIGPNPAINGYVQSKGSIFRIIAGASSGGVLFVVRSDAHMNSPSDLSGKKIADPQVGGTQDIALRHYLQQRGLNTTDKGGTVQIVPTNNSTIVNLFKQKQIDGAWVPEPYASRLVVEGNGKVFLDERSLWPHHKFVTTNIVVRTDFLNQHPDIVKAFLKAHVDSVQYIQAHLADAKNLVNQQLASVPGGKKLAQQTIDDAFKDLDITYDPLAQSLFTAANNAYALGYLGTQKPDLSGIYDLAPLNSVLKSKGLTTVTTA